MLEILIKSFAFLAIILLGHLLRRLHFFEESDFHVLSKIVLKITLPATIISNFTGNRLQISMLLLTLIGFGCGALMILTAIISTFGQSAEHRALYVLCVPGFNIGNFTLPFVQSFLGPAGVIATSIFDVGNAFICLGGTYGIASALKNDHSEFSWGLIPKMLFRSVPFDAYLVMAILSFCGLALPSPLIAVAGIIGNANPFLAMLMIGVGFRLSSDRNQALKIIKILGIHYGVAIFAAILIFLFLPFPLEYRQTLTLLVLSPIASAAPAFAAELGCDFGLASAASSISILISIFLITATLIIIL